MVLAAGDDATEPSPAATGRLDSAGRDRGLWRAEALPQQLLRTVLENDSE
jgi:hypothetical protein